MATNASDTTRKRRVDFLARMKLVAFEAAPDEPSVSKRPCAELVAFTSGEVWVLNCIAGGSSVHTRDSASTRRRDAATRHFLLAMRTLTQITEAERRTQRMTAKTTPAVDPNESIFTRLERDLFAKEVAGFMGVPS